MTSSVCLWLSYFMALELRSSTEKLAPKVEAVRCFLGSDHHSSHLGCLLFLLDEPPSKSEIGVAFPTLPFLSQSPKATSCQNKEWDPSFLTSGLVAF